MLCVIAFVTDIGIPFVTNVTVRGFVIVDSVGCVTTFVIDGCFGFVVNVLPVCCVKSFVIVNGLGFLVILVVAEDVVCIFVVFLNV